MSEIIVRERVSAQVHRHLRDRILRGDYAPGARLIETDLAGELRVSRTPVREAFLLLQGQHLVRPLQAGGVAVCDYRRELLDIFDIRIALETHAVQRGGKSIGEPALVELDRVCMAMERLPADAVEERADLNRRFHETLIATADNHRLVRLVNDYQEFFSAVQPLFAPGYLRRTQREHREIVAALRDRDVARTTRLIGDHIRHAAEQTIGLAGGAQRDDAAGHDAAGHDAAGHDAVGRTAAIGGEWPRDRRPRPNAAKEGEDDEGDI